MRCLRLVVLAYSFLSLLCGGAAQDETVCDDPAPIRKKYTQDNAPQDMKEALQEITQLVNKRFQEVLKVELKYLGKAIHRAVGLHRVITVVQLLEDGEKVSRCVVVEIEILDVNECELPRGHPMADHCHKTAMCVNTNGSYACECPNGEPAVPGAGNGLCGGKHSTLECCEVRCPRGDCLKACKEDFRCYTNSCPGDCVEEAVCVASLGDYSCKCKEPLVGNGHRCKNNYKPLLLKDRNDNLLTPAAFTCGCQLPVVDWCDGIDCGAHSSCHRLEEGYECACDPGFTFIENFGCVDESLPSLELVGPNPMVLRQCDSYTEPGLHILDENSEDYARTLEVDYSRPLGQCLMNLGTFSVDYTIQTNWTDPKNVSVRREVVVLDVDECSLPPEVFARCPGCEPQCVPEAECLNTDGSYTCRCPPCTDGDGFKPHVARAGGLPDGYEGGTGCRDICPPVLTLLGGDVKVFNVCKCTGLLGDEPYERDYDAELRELVRRSNGQELCEPADRPCIRAIDETGAGKVDLTARVDVGVPYKVSPSRWRVPYSVSDDAGNAAVPVEREIVVQELTLEEYANLRGAELAEARVAAAIAAKPQPTLQECPRCAECPSPSPSSLLGAPEGGGAKPVLELRRAGGSRRRRQRQQPPLLQADGNVAVAVRETVTYDESRISEVDGEFESLSVERQSEVFEETCLECPPCPDCSEVAAEAAESARREATAAAAAAQPLRPQAPPINYLGTGLALQMVVLFLVLACLMMLLVLGCLLLWNWLGPGAAEPATPYRNVGGARRLTNGYFSGAAAAAAGASATPGAASSIDLSTPASVPGSIRNRWTDGAGSRDDAVITPSRLTRASPRPPQSTQSLR